MPGPGGGGMGSALRASPSSLPSVARFEPTWAFALLPTEGVGWAQRFALRRARSLRSLGSNPRGLSPYFQRRGWDGLSASRFAELAPFGRSVRTHVGFRPTSNGGGGIRTHVGLRPPVFKTGAFSRSATPPGATPKKTAGAAMLDQGNGVARPQEPDSRVIRYRTTRWMPRSSRLTAHTSSPSKTGAGLGEKSPGGFTAPA